MAQVAPLLDHTGAGSTRLQVALKKVPAMRRTPRLILTLVAILVLLLGTGASETRAARGWCMADPLIMVDGQLADVFVSSDISMLLKASGPIQMVITIPTGSKGSVILTDLGFGRGYKISFQQSSSLTRTSTHTQVKVSVYAPNTGSKLPEKVTFAPRSLSSGLLAILIGQSASGYSNSWVRLTTA